MLLKDMKTLTKNARNDFGFRKQIKHLYPIQFSFGQYIFFINTCQPVSPKKMQAKTPHENAVFFIF